MRVRFIFLKISGLLKLFLNGNEYAKQMPRCFHAVVAVVIIIIPTPQRDVSRACDENSSILVVVWVLVSVALYIPVPNMRWRRPFHPRIQPVVDTQVQFRTVLECERTQILRIPDLRCFQASWAPYCFKGEVLRGS